MKGPHPLPATDAPGAFSAHVASNASKNLRTGNRWKFPQNAAKSFHQGFLLSGFVFGAQRNFGLMARALLNF